MYYNLTVLTFKNSCSQLVEKIEYIGECLYNLQDCCKNAISETIYQFDTCENNTKYICEYKERVEDNIESNDGINMTKVFMYGMAGGATFWLLINFLKICYEKKCVNKNEYSLEDLDDEEFP